MPPELDIEDVVDIDAYPILDRDHPARAELVARCKTDLEKNMYCAIPNFVCPSALKAMAEEASDLRPQAYDNNSRRNVYLQRQADSSLPDDHARNHFNSTSTRMIAYDQIGKSSPLKVFYHSDVVRELIADIVGSDELFDNEDPYQPAESGGEFQMSPNSRTDTDQNYDHVAQVLRGERDDTITSVGREPGALCIFRGCNSLHRVSPVKGETMRIMGVFVYEREPGVLGDQEINETIYGSRVAKAG